MNLGISIKKGVGKELTPEYLDFYQKNGITHLELSILDCSEDSPFFTENFKKIVDGLSRDFSISYHSIIRINFIHPQRSVREDAFNQLVKMLRLCDDTKAKWLTVHIGCMLGLKFLLPKRLGKFADDLNALYHALGFHTPICIENMPIVRKKLAGERFSELERVLAKVESSRCGLLLDTGHYFIMRDCRISQSDTLSRTLGVHVHNNYGQHDDHNYICDGVHDPGPLLKQVLAAAPEAKLILENYSMDFGAIVKSIEYLNNLFR